MERVVRAPRVLVLVILLVCVHESLCWSGNYCSRSDCRYVTKRVCSYRTWLGCCAYKTVSVPQTYTVKFCCNGWRHNGNQVCTIPVCSPPCANGGTCIEPNKCNCRFGFSGPLCRNSECSHRHPCYPGSCVEGTTRCNCVNGFTSAGRGDENNCLKLESQNKPTVLQMQSRMSYHAKMKGSLMEMWSLLSDSSDRNDMDFIWSNRKQFNKVEITASSQFNTGDLPPRPDYVSASDFGVVAGSAHIRLTKDRLRTRRSTRYLSLNQTIECQGGVTSFQPDSGVFSCNIEERFDRLLDTGDRLTITYTTRSGGFRRLKDLNTGRTTQSQEFKGQENSMAVEFRFDLDPPFHCQDTGSCGQGEQPLAVEDITKDTLRMRWEGWLDSLSGMHRYAVEVFPLDPTLEGTLRIVKPLEPLFIRAVNHSRQMAPLTYDPPEPGMYAVILEAADLANNTKYVRRLTLYDPVSKVTVDPDLRLFFSSASPMANFSYQDNINSPIVLNWNRVFTNRLHEEKSLLGQVEAYPPQLEDNVKTILPAADDLHGDRTVDAIPNERGIVNFQLTYIKVSQVDEDEHVDPPPSASWTDLDLQQTFTIPADISVDEGDSVIAWVRASDVMGNDLIQRAHVTFDTTPADVEELKFRMNEQVPGIDFSSTFELTAQDQESGIAAVRWTFTRSNGTVIFTDTVPGRTVQRCRGFRDCYCTPRGVCYSVDQSYSLSNCHMMVEKESLATEVIYVTSDVINSAGLTLSKRMEKGQLTMLNGTEAYFPPQHVRLLLVSESSATLTWDFPPSCYVRTDLWVVAPDSSGKDAMHPVHKDTKQYALSNLEPDRQYDIQLIARYAGEVKSDPVTFTFKTEEAAGLTGGEAAGVSVGVLLLVLVAVLVLLAFIVRRRGLPPALQGGRIERLHSSIKKKRDSEKHLNEYVTHTSASAAVAMHDNGPDDLYLAAEDTWGTGRPAWQVEARHLVLNDQIAEGKFADIYRATWTQESSRTATVAAKILKTGFNENDANKLVGKIHFFANEVGKHENVLLFHGAVLDNQFLGPVMMLEYCEVGQVDKWLAGKGGVANEDCMEKLFSFSRDIACGMQYLASKKIVHNRLAARNVLLTFLLDAKVAGFGPKDGTDSKVPAKWAAPEVLEEKPATEKSDVWSYGVTLWEIFSLGKAPYAKVRGSEMGTYLKQGKRMEKPEFADDMFHSLMQRCWDAKPSGRPTFADIKKQLCALFSSGARNSSDLYYMTNQMQK